MGSETEREGLVGPFGLAFEVADGERQMQHQLPEDRQQVEVSAST